MGLHASLHGQSVPLNEIEPPIAEIEPPLAAPALLVDPSQPCPLVREESSVFDQETEPSPMTRALSHL